MRASRDAEEGWERRRDGRGRGSGLHSREGKEGLWVWGLWDAYQVGKGVTASPVGPPALGFGVPSTTFLQPARGYQGDWGSPRGLLGWDGAVPRGHGLIVTSPQDPNWYKAKNKVGREGIIPANYVQKREGVKAGIKLSLMP